MSKSDFEDEVENDDEDVEIDIDTCDICGRSMSNNEFAFLADEDFMEEKYPPEMLEWLIKNFRKLCYGCLKQAIEKGDSVKNK